MPNPRGPLDLARALVPSDGCATTRGDKGGVTVGDNIHTNIPMHTRRARVSLGLVETFHDLSAKQAEKPEPGCFFWVMLVIGQGSTGQPTGDISDTIPEWPKSYVLMSLMLLN